MMKRFVLLLMMCTCVFQNKMKACFSAPDWDGGTSFLIIKPYSTDELAYRSSMLEETVTFWYEYLKHKVTVDEIRDYFKSADIDSFKDDMQNNAFLKQLRNDTFAQKYLTACLQLQAATQESWDYDRRESMKSEAAKSLRLLGNVPAAFEYRVALLQMRVYSFQDDIAKLKQVWNTKGKNCPEGTLKNRLKGYYAQALLQEKQTFEAFDIYAQLGDECSMNMIISKFSGYQGIKTLADFSKQNNSQMVYYVMQDFANYYWSQTRWLDEESSSLQGSDAMRDANRVKELCRENMNGKDKALWMNLLAWLEMCDGNNAEAMQIAEQAMKQSTDALPRDNAQRILMLSRLRNASVIANDKELKQIAQDFKSLVAAAQKEAKIPVVSNEDNYYSVYHSEQYAAQRPNLCLLLDTYHPALDKYLAEHKLTQARVFAMIINEDVDFASNVYEDDVPSDYLTSVWGNRWYSILNDEFSIEEVNNFMEAIKSKKANDAFAKEVIKQCQVPEQALYDLIGTKLMRNGKYGQALPYLQKLSADYILSTHYQAYLATRKYMPQSMFERKQTSDPDYDMAVTDSRNYKAEFCQQMVNDINRLNTLNGEQKALLELDMAGRMFQASSYGDLWALSDFAWSAYRDESHEDLLCNQARNMLKKALVDCNTQKTKFNIYYGLALVPAGGKPFYSLHYDWDTEDYTYSFELFHPAREAYDYLKQYRETNEQLSSCDVLKWYVQRQGI